MVAFHEADWVAHVCSPPHPAWDRLKEALVAYSRSRGVDLFIGRRVTQMLHAAGLMPEKELSYMPGGVFPARQEAAYPYPPTFREEVFSETCIQDLG